VMGRAEAFALQNPPILSIVDGLANGIGYAVVLAIIGFCRELLGAGEIFGRTIPVFSNWYTPNQLMILAPGAFFALGIVIGIFNLIKGPAPEEKK
jgi:Na+-transporting NADH:ubiquinone oxidoreductase subunit D